MMSLTIKRIALIENGTFGVLIDKRGIPFATTAERPWLNNARSISCIPAGDYICKRVQSPKFGNTFEITNVPDRTHILFHKGNIPKKDSHGCILIGEQFGLLNGKAAVLSSRAGYTEFMKMLETHDMFTLKIEEV